MSGPRKSVTRRSVLGALAGAGVCGVPGSGTAMAAGGDVEWTHETGNGVYSSPTVADETVFVGSLDTNMYALDAATGDVEWDNQTGGWVKSSPTVADGTVFVGSNDNNVYALDVATGEVSWTHQTGSRVLSSPTVADGTVFVGSDSVYALDAGTGEVAWTHQAAGRVESSPTVADGTVFVGSDASVYALDAATGDLEWTYQTDAGVKSSPTVADETVFVGSNDTTVYALDGVTGEMAWTHQTDGLVFSSPTVADGTVFVGSYDDRMYALDVDTGGVVWTQQTGSRVLSSPTVAGETVFVGSNDNSMYAFDAETGDVEWTYRTNRFVRSSPTVADGTVFVGSYDNNVYAFDAGADVLESSEGSRVLLGTLGHYGTREATVARPGDDGSDTTADGSTTSPDDGSSGDGGLRTAEMAAIGGGGGLALLFGAYALMRRAGDGETEAGREQDTHSGSDTPSNEATDSTTQQQPNSGNQETASNVRRALDSAERALDSAATALDNGNPETAVDHLESVTDTLDGAGQTVAEHDLNGLADRIDSLERRHEHLGERIDDARTGVPTIIPTTSRHSLSYDDIERGEAIGQGGNADVFRGTARTADGTTITLAVKEPRTSGTLNAGVVESMMTEAETWQQLDDHDHIVSVVDYDSTPIPWIAMEHMNGGHLGQRTDEMSSEQKLWTAITIIKAVRYAHRRGVAHLDLKPENVLLRSVENAWDVPKVADWGLSKQLLERSEGVEGLSPQYAAPEQFDEQYGSVDDVTDIYQLGAILYELFTGQPPFEGRPTMVMNKALTERPDPPSTVADVPPALDDVLQLALEKRKEDRYESVLYLRDELQGLLEAY